MATPRSPRRPGEAATVTPQRVRQRDDHDDGGDARPAPASATPRGRHGRGAARPAASPASTAITTTMKPGADDVEQDGGGQRDGPARRAPSPRAGARRPRRGDGRRRRATATIDLDTSMPRGRRGQRHDRHRERRRAVTCRHADQARSALGPPCSLRRRISDRDSTRTARSSPGRHRSSTTAWPRASRLALVVVGRGVGRAALGDRSASRSS